MSARRKALLFVLGTAGFVAVLLSFLVFLVPRLLNVEAVKSRLLSELERQAGVRLSFDRAEIVFFPRPRLSLDGVALSVPGRAEVTMKRLEADISPLSLLRNRVPVGSLLAVAPEIRVRIPEREKPPSLDEIGEKISSLLAQLGVRAPGATVTVRDGRLDLSEGERPLLSLRDLQARVAFPPDRLRLRLSCVSQFWDRLEIEGTLRSEGVRSLRADISGTISAMELRRGSRTLALRGATVAGAVRLEGGNLHASVSRLEFASPRVRLAGTLSVGETSPRIRLEISGQETEIAPVRSAILSLAGDVPAVRSALDIVRGGFLPRFSARVTGNSLEDLGDPMALEASAPLQGGTIFLPGVGGTGLTLSEVAGSAIFSKGILSGEGITARSGDVRAREGTVRLGLARADPPFHADFLAAADPGEAQSLVRRIVTDPDFRRELDRFKDLRGSISGRVILGERISSIRPILQVTEVRLTTRYDRLPFPLAIAGGKIAYEGKRIETSGLKGRLGASSFSGLNGDLLLGEARRWNVFSGQARLSADELVPWLSSTVIAHDVLKELRSARGTVELSSITAGGPLETAGEWRYEASGRGIDLVLDMSPLPGPVTIRRGDFHLLPGIVSFSGFEASMLDAIVRGSAEFRYSGGRISRAAGSSLEGEVGEKATGWASSRLQVPPDLTIRAPLSATASSFSWEKGGPVSFKGDFHRPDGAALSVSLRETPEELTIDSLVLRDTKSAASLTLHLGPKDARLKYKGGLYRSTVEKFVAIPAHPFRHIEGDLSLSVDLENPDRSEAIGTLEGEGIRIPWKPLDPLLIRSASLSAEGKKIRVVSSDLAWREIPFRLRGEGSFSREGLEADVDVETGDIPLERLLPQSPGSAKTAVDSGGPPVADAGYRLPKLPVRGVFRLRSDSIRYGRWVVNAVTARGEIGPGALHVSVSEGDLCGFPLHLSATLDTKGLAVALQTSASGKDLKVPLLCLLDRQVDATGSFRFTTRISARGTDSESMLRSLEGPVELTARDGRINRWHLLSKILAVLNVTNVIRGTLPDFRKEGIPYKAARFHGEYKGKTLHLTEGTLYGPTIGIAASGQVDLGTSQMDVKMLVAPFRTVDWIIRNIPLVRYVMKKTFLSVPFTVKGDYHDPSVRIDPVGAGAGLLGVLGRTINLPVKILEGVLHKLEPPK
ncbi:MAG: hypothetical protein ACYC24_00240 [Desulfobacteria bacterium]